MPQRGVIGRFGFCDRGHRVEGLFYHGVVMVKLRWARLVFGLPREMASRQKYITSRHAITKDSDTATLRAFLEFQLGVLGQFHGININQRCNHGMMAIRRGHFSTNTHQIFSV
jgi:hypothetical protein